MSKAISFLVVTGKYRLEFVLSGGKKCAGLAPRRRRDHLSIAFEIRPLMSIGIGKGYLFCEKW